MAGTADGGQTAGQDAPEDLVSVREAAHVVGFTPPCAGWLGHPLAQRRHDHPTEAT